MSTHRPPCTLASAVGTGLSAPVLALAGVAPWLVILAAILELLAWLAVTLVQATFPQDSKERLTWWLDRRQRRRPDDTGSEF
jgi:hypothetical protein